MIISFIAYAQYKDNIIGVFMKREKSEANSK